MMASPHFFHFVVNENRFATFKSMGGAEILCDQIQSSFTLHIAFTLTLTFTLTYTMHKDSATVNAVHSKSLPDAGNFY